MEAQEHRRWLMSALRNESPFVYIGDTVQVAKGSHAGSSGVVTDLRIGLQGVFNIDYLIYALRTPEGRTLEAYLYTLKRQQQTPSNRLLENVLTERTAALRY